MKRVPRRMTYRGMTRRAPWSWRETRTDRGAPRTCLTNMNDPVFYEPDSPEPLELGRFDYLLRLYRHYGASPVSVEHSGGIAYFEREWQELMDKRVEWFEFVNPRQGTASRIAFGTALRYGSWVPTPRGFMWVVPSQYFTTVSV